MQITKKVAQMVTKYEEEGAPSGFIEVLRHTRFYILTIIIIFYAKCLHVVPHFSWEKDSIWKKRNARQFQIRFI